MRFWDSSAIVPLLVPEAMSRALQRLFEADSFVFGWRGTRDRVHVGHCAPARVHDLVTADALQLAAAFFVAEARPSTLEFVSLDDRLLVAACHEGFLMTRPTP